MAALRNLRIGVRLAVCFVALILIQLLVVGLSWRSMQQMEARAEAIYKDRIVPMGQIKVIADAYAVNVVDAVNKVNSGQLGVQAALRAMFLARRQIDQAWRDYLATELTEEEQKLVREAEALFRVADKDLVRVTQHLQRLSGNVEGELNDDSRALYASVDPVSAKLSELAELQVRVAKEEVAESQRVDARTRFVLVLASSVSLLFALAAGLVVSHSVTDAVQEGGTVCASAIQSTVEPPSVGRAKVGGLMV